MPEQPSVQELLGNIRERVRSRAPERTRERPPAVVDSLGNLSELQRQLHECNLLCGAVGTLNPRNPGLVNAGIQFAKRVMRRGLSWYTRPLHQFQEAATRTLNETTKLLESLLAAQQHPEAAQQYLERERLEMLQKADSHLGARAQAGLWFNEPIGVHYDEARRPTWSSTSERIVEKAWLLRRLGAIPVGSRVLDVGSAESTLSLELASSGYQVTGIDVRPLALEHPNLNFVQRDICDSGLPAGHFDLVIALSTLEHIGLGAYGDSRASSVTVAMKEIRRVLKPGGRLLVTVPFGSPAVTAQHRIFDGQGLRSLLEEFAVESLEYGKRLDRRTWLAPVPEEQVAGAEHDAESGAPGAVAMAVCSRLD